jgi:hypothetical protein
MISGSNVIIKRFIQLVLWLLLIVFCCYGVIYYRGIYRRSPRIFPRGIVIHHTVTPPSAHGHKFGVAEIDLMHKRRGFLVKDYKTGKEWHIGYHFLVQQDGTVLTGRPEYLYGEHTRNHNDMLGIALIGNFEAPDNQGLMGPLSPPPAQVAAVAKLARYLMRKYDLNEKQVFFHRELGQTACPGRSFQKKYFLRVLRTIE